MGAEDFYPEERPVHRVSVDGFWMDETPVTAAQFWRFVRETKYVTLAERPLDPAQFPDADPELLVPGSLVFRKSAGPVDLNDHRNWWKYAPGAYWKRPGGKGTTINGRDGHPVIHIAYEDAEAYATWAGKELPTEAEWELAARGGLDGAVFAWGDEHFPEGKAMANTWQGEFPWQNLKLDGYEGTSPVGSFPPNGYGLYDVAGNVWEWTCDWFTQSIPMTWRTRAACRATRGSPQPRSCPERRSHVASSRAARTSARPTTACATARLRARGKRSTRRQHTSASVASYGALLPKRLADLGAARPPCARTPRSEIGLVAPKV